MIIVTGLFKKKPELGKDGLPKKPSILKHTWKGMEKGAQVGSIAGGLAGGVAGAPLGPVGALVGKVGGHYVGELAGMAAGATKGLHKGVKEKVAFNRNVKEAEKMGFKKPQVRTSTSGIIAGLIPINAKINWKKAAKIGAGVGLAGLGAGMAYHAKKTIDREKKLAHARETFKKFDEKKHGSLKDRAVDAGILDVFRKTPATPRYTAHKDSKGQHYVKDSVTGFQRSFPDKDTAGVFADQQNKIHTMQKRIDEGGGPGLKNGLKGLGWSTAKTAVPLAVGGAITYGWNRLNKKSNTPKPATPVTKK